MFALVRSARTRWLVFFGIALVVIGLTSLYFLSGNITGDTLLPDVRPVSENDHVLGDLAAPVTLIVYTDFECPYCRRFHHDTLPALQRHYGAEISIVYRHFPLPSRPKALPEAEAAECAYDLGGHEAFWRFVDTLFAITTSNNGLDLTRLPSIAAEAGLDEDAFRRCQNEGRGSERVRADQFDGVRAGVEVTPSILVIGSEHSVFVAGDYSARIRAAIDYVRTTESALPRSPQ